MKSKKVLIPETRPRQRRIQRERPNRHSSEPVSLPSTVSSRQRSEALGLVLIGVSAFSFASLYYLQPSDYRGLLGTVSVNLGVGVYIIPAILGLTGFQRFFERPLANFPSRMFGTIGTLVFGLGLLGLEGGKVGITVFRAAVERWGFIPSKILFLFLALSSLVFALDILYKDLLLAVLGIIRIFCRGVAFAWDLLLTMLALGIEAGRSTWLFISLCAKGLHEWMTRPTEGIDEEKSLSFFGFPQLLPATTSPANASLAESGAEPTHTYPEDSHDPIIPEPSCWRNNLHEEELITSQMISPDRFADPQPICPPLPSVQQMNPAAPTAVTPADAFSVQIREVAPIVHMTDSPLISHFTLSPLATPEQPTAKKSGSLESPKDKSLADRPAPVPTETVPESADHQEVLAQATSSAETSSEAELDDEDSDDEDFSTEDEDASDDSPVTLDDHPIDRDLKHIRTTALEAPKEPPKEILLPSLDLLRVPPPPEPQTQSDLSERSALLLKTLEEFGIKAQITAIVEGPAVSRFELKPAPGVKVARITSLADDITLALSAPAIRIEAPIPGKPALGIEIPNPKPTPVFFYDLVRNEKFRSPETLLNLGLGVTISGRPVFADLTDMPHLLIAGSTGSGKSVCVNTIIASILFQARADQVKMVMIDPKMVELSSYNGIPHLISPVVTDPKKAAAALLWAVEEMERRYRLLADCGMRKISTYNEELPRLQRDFDASLASLPFIVIIIDELADLMMTASAEVEGSICRLAQMARAVGIHLIIATQRPSVDVLTGIIKANLPSRIAFSVASQIDSRTILDTKGAERLLGKGDMLFVPKGRSKPLRLQGAYISDAELMAITEWVKGQGTPEYIDIAPTREDDGDVPDLNDSEDADEDTRLLIEIETYVLTQEKTSTSMLQRKFKIGYNRAARIMDLLEQKGIVSPLDGANKRRVIKRSNA